MLVISDRLNVPLRELSFTFVRSGGPGGQNVNKVASKAVLRWRVIDSVGLPIEVRERVIAHNRRRMNREGDLILTSQRFRNQGQNVADCLEKLRQIVIDAATIATVRKPTRPTKGSHASAWTTNAPTRPRSNCGRVPRQRNSRVWPWNSPCRVCYNELEKWGLADFSDWGVARPWLSAITLTNCSENGRMRRAA